GVYTAPASPGTYHVVATSSADSTKTGSATVTVSQPPLVSVSVSPKAATIQRGASQPFSCAVTGAQDTSCNWSVAEIGGGMVTPPAGTSTLYTPPAAAGTYHVVATSNANPSSSDSA